MNLGNGQEINECTHDEVKGEEGREMIQRENEERIKWRQGDDEKINERMRGRG